MEKTLNGGSCNFVCFNFGLKEENEKINNVVILMRLKYSRINSV